MSRMDYIRFDVRHHLFVCHRLTINKFPASKLAELIRPNNDQRQSPDEYILIDRDGRFFGDILNYMRDTSSLNLTSWNYNDICRLEEEAKFYNIQGIVDICETGKALKTKPETNPSTIHEEKFVAVPAGKILDHLVGSNKLNYLFSYKLYESDKFMCSLLELVDPSNVDVCCFIGKFPGAEDANSLIYNPANKEIIIASDSLGESDQWAMLFTVQKMSRLGPAHYYKIPQFCTMLGVNNDPLPQELPYEQEEDDD